MSIFGYAEEVKPDVTKKFVTEQDRQILYTSLLRNGSLPMTGLLNMNDNRIQQVSEPVESSDVATKSYVDIKTKKSVITIWAEERGALGKDTFEWAFGNGGGNKDVGYTMITDGRILGIGLSTVGRSGNAPGRVWVVINVNGREEYGYGVLLVATKAIHTKFVKPLEVRAGSVINFISKVANPNTVESVVSLLIELDLYKKKITIRKEKYETTDSTKFLSRVAYRRWAEL